MYIDLNGFLIIKNVGNNCETKEQEMQFWNEWVESEGKKIVTKIIITKIKSNFFSKRMLKVKNIRYFLFPTVKKARYSIGIPETVTRVAKLFIRWC